MAYTVKDKNFLEVIDALKAIEDVDAVALGGSRVQKNDDKMSDYDVYVYCKNDVGYEQRSKALLPLCSQAEICNNYWESEDNCIMNNGVPVDIIYRKVEMFEPFINMLIEGKGAMNGYSTAFLHNIITCEVLFDKSGRFTEFKKKVSVPYPENMRKSIITKNRNLLSGKLPSYDIQIKKAYERGDFVSVHHRITEFLASYFDIIFALNRLTHPGEKRLVELCRKNCKILPERFEENINALLGSTLNGNSYDIVTDMISELDRVLCD